MNASFRVRLLSFCLPVPALALILVAGCAPAPSQEVPQTSSPGSSIPAPDPVEPAQVPEMTGAPQPIPPDLAATIRRAMTAFEEADYVTALAELSGREAFLAQGMSIEKAAESLPPLNVVLLYGTLERLLELEPRLSDDGEHASFATSDVTLVRFHKMGDQWRLDENRSLDPATPGIRYDEPGPHAAFLLRHLIGGDAKPAVDAMVPDDVKALASAVDEAGAGLAVLDGGGSTAGTALVIPRAWTDDTAELPRIAEVSHLRVLALYDAALGPESIARFAALPELTHLRITRDRITDELLAAVGTLKGLTSLSLTAGSPGYVSLAPLNQLKQLETLELIGIGFQPDDLVVLAKLPNLRRLDLTNSSLSDAGLKHLAAFPRLESLRVSAREITAEAVLELKRAKPGLYVDW